MSNLSRRRSFKAGALALLALFTSSLVQAEVRLSIPEETFGPPFYARLEFPTVDSNLIPTNGEWAALVLYRQPECIPETFNLLQVFDVPAAFDCPLGNIGGYEVYENAPGIDPAPRHTRLTGAGEVAIWFVTLAEFNQVAADGVVTIVDVENMASLRKGVTDFYDELLRPSQSNEEILLHIQANGRLDDGGAFRLVYTVNGDPRIRTRVRTRIEFPSQDALPDEAPLSVPYTGHWYTPELPGEGIGLHPVRGRDQLFGTWFTVNDAGEQIWYALDSTAFDGMVADFDILLSFGPDPAAPNGVALEKAGEMTIEFLTCTSADVVYELDGQVGAFDLTSLIPSDNCLD